MADEQNNNTDSYVLYKIYIPRDWIITYHRILILMADYGAEMLKDCKAGCTSRNKNVVDCYNMFSAAIAAKLTGDGKKASVIIDYINSQLSLLYGDLDTSKNTLVAIGEDLNPDTERDLYGIISSDERIELELNPDDGFLYKTIVKDGKPIRFKEVDGEAIPFDDPTIDTTDNTDNSVIENTQEDGTEEI